VLEQLSAQKLVLALKKPEQQRQQLKSGELATRAQEQQRLQASPHAKQLSDECDSSGCGGATWL
jgi:hypothetical protein